MVTCRFLDCNELVQCRVMNLNKPLASAEMLFWFIESRLSLKPDVVDGLESP